MENIKLDATYLCQVCFTGSDHPIHQFGTHDFVPSENPVAKMRKILDNNKNLFKSTMPELIQVISLARDATVYGYSTDHVIKVIERALK